MSSGRAKRSRVPNAATKAFEAGRTTNARGLSAVGGVLEVRRVGRRSEALIDWVGVDPATGKTWEPSWERVSGVALAELREETKRRLPAKAAREAALPLPHETPAAMPPLP